MSTNSFRHFMMIWTGEFISSIGSGLTAFALGVYAFQMTQTASSVALITLCAFLPSIVLSPFGGLLADRFDRRLMMILGDVGSAFGLIYILIVMMAGDAALWQIGLGVMISSIFVSLMEPAYKASITDLLTTEQYARASGLVQLAAASKYLISPFLAGLLLSFASIQTVLIIDISTFIVTTLTIMTVRRSLQAVHKLKAKASWVAELKEGWNVIASERGILMLIGILSLITFYVGFLQTLFTPMLLPVTDSQTLGVVMSVSAAGMLVGSLIIGVFNLAQKYTLVMAVGLGAAGLFYSWTGLTTNMISISAAGFMFFLTLPFINTAADVLIRHHIANETQGRAWGIIGILTQLGYVAAYAAAGVLADRIFNPLLVDGGVLAPTVGRWIGTGEGRGIGFLFLLSGLLVLLTAFVIPKLKSIRALERLIRL